jgi:hypothetical protein
LDLFATIIRSFPAFFALYALVFVQDDLVRRVSSPVA